MYIGRFAPSPTGPLHFGSLVAAVASYLEARAHQGLWLLRMEDLDQARALPAAAETIMQALAAFGFEWDDAVMYQSQRHAAYAEALVRLQDAGLVYACACSRREIADSALAGVDADSALAGINGGLVYPGTCRHGLAAGKQARAWRVKTQDRAIAFDDAIQGQITQNLAFDTGDFVLKRADGFYAYQLAVVVDDAAQGVTHIVRGADLLDSTPRQLFLQQLLGFAQPIYAHVPVASNLQGEKLSKQTLAQALDAANPVAELWQALQFLGQRPPPELKRADIKNLWDWARTSWQMARVPRQHSIAVADLDNGHCAPGV